MRKIIAFLVLGHFIAFGQNGNSNIENQKLYLPNIIPPSPEAFSISEFGKNSANEYTGKLNLSIPIYDYSDGSLNFPISLNYSGAGVKVEDIASWVGINWNLNVGGVITRQIKDGSDEGNTVNRVIVDKEHLINNANKLCNIDSQFYSNLVRNGDDFDTEVDIFNFSFLGYSGSFYLDQLFNPVYIENENEINIEIIGIGTNNLNKFRNSYTFQITTPDGVKYLFGGLNTETTRVMSGSLSLDNDGVTSFYLSEIVHPVKGKIILEYDTLGPEVMKISKGYDMTTMLRSNVGPENLTYVTNFVERIFKTKVINPKRLKKIKNLNSNEEIIFNREDYENNNFNSVLKSIEVRSSNQTILKKIDFEYLARANQFQQSNNFIESSRFFLTKVIINNGLTSNTNKNEIYSFEYDNPHELPNRMSNSRDFLGYFNNINNSSLISKHSHYTFNLPNNFADLTPNFNYSKKGSLIKVVYPTKGYSVFEYEPTPAKKTKNTRYNLGICSFSENDLELPYQINIPGNNTSSSGSFFMGFPTVYNDQTIKFKLDISTIAHSNTNLLNGKGIKFIINDLTNNTTKTFMRTYPIFNNQEYQYDLKGGHNYSFALSFINNYSSNEFQAIYGNVNFKVFEGFEITGGYGVRLKKDTNYNFNNEEVSKKRYYYGGINGDYNTISSYKTLDYNPKITFIQGEAEEIGLGLTSCKMNGVFSSEIVDLGNIIPESKEIFPKVSISYGGDNFENGGVEKTFLHISDNKSGAKRIKVSNDGCFDTFINGVYCDDLDNFPYTLNPHIIISNYIAYDKSNDNCFNGKLINERTYKKQNNQLFKIKEKTTNFVFSLNTNKTITNFIGKEIIKDNVSSHYCINNSSLLLQPISNLYFGYYQIKVFNTRLIEEKEFNYFDPIPMNHYVKFNDSYDLQILGFHDSYGVEELVLPSQDQIEAPYKKITTTQTYEYGTLKGLPTAITSSTSEDATVNKTVNTYVNIASTLPNIPSTQAALYTSLLAQNRVGEPVQVQQFQNTALLSTQRTLYKNWLIGEYSKILPEKIQISKGLQPLEDKALFYNYDTNFNPAVMGYAAAPRTKYIFNTDGLVVAKIENYTGTATSFPVITGNIDNTSCSLQIQNPTAFVTVFTYDLITKKLLKITDSKCQNTFYVYDTLQRLQFIKDHDGNIVKEFDQQFKPQN